MLIDPVVRYTKPCKCDIAEFGTIYKVMGDNDSYELFVQLGSNPEATEWHPIGTLLERSFHRFLLNKEFITLCLHATSCTEKSCKHNKDMWQLLSQ